MGACKPGCSCRRHIPKPLSPEVVQRRSEALLGHEVSVATREKISRSLTGRRLNDEQRARRSEIVYPPRTDRQKSGMSKLAIERGFGANFRGGSYADSVYELLVRGGFTREHSVQHGTTRGAAYHLDFAHVEGKINIELDGPGHKSLPYEDEARDSWLKARGWRVIRVRHE